MRFPPSFIERLRSHFLMSEVIGRRMPIKKHGREYHGLCPFHNEKTPSFTVNDEKAFYHCFGCGAHGDAIEFVRKFDRVSYAEAIESLAREAGLAMPQPSIEESRKQEAQKTLYDVLEAACQWFEKQLHATNGAIALDYVQQRGIKPETQRIFRLGYAPDDRTGLHNYLNEAGFVKTLQLEAGLIIQPDSGQFYDRFRGRLMFPIRSASGKVVAFGGRILTAGKTTKHVPKYLNSPESPLFKKGELLYNLDIAKKPARDENFVVVMEGYMDVISTWQAGISCAVATLGTAVTPEHLRLLWQLAKEPVMCLDGDAAGERALWRAAEVALPLLKPGHSLRFATLPKEDDPDTFVQKHGAAGFKKLLTSQPPLHQQIWQRLLKLYGKSLESPEGRANLEQMCTKLTDAIAELTVRKYYKQYFINALWSVIREKQIKLNAPKARVPQVEHLLIRSDASSLDRLVQRMLSILITFPALLHKSQVEEALLRLETQDTQLRSLCGRVLALDGADEAERQRLLTEMQEVLASKAPVLSHSDTMQPEEALQLWNETLALYDISRLENELKDVELKMGQQMDENSYNRLVELQQALRKAQSSRTFAPAETEAL